MYLVPVSIGTSAGVYWGNRARQAKLDLMRSKNSELRAVYGELLEHYKRMAELLESKPSSRVSNERHPNPEEAFEE